MAFTHWESLKKIDARIHILPDAVHKANPDSDDVWLCTDIHGYCAMWTICISKKPSSCR